MLLRGGRVGGCPTWVALGPWAWIGPSRIECWGAKTDEQTFESLYMECKREENSQNRGSEKQEQIPQSVYQTLDLWCGNREYGKQIGSVVKYYKRVKLNEFVHCKNSLGF